jgi:protein-S-isoprenylcysteine O-methyltransferase Ste14
MLAILLGNSIIIGNLIAFIYPILFVLIITTLFIPMGKKNLVKATCKEYESYKKQVRRRI